MNASRISPTERHDHGLLTHRQFYPHIFGPWQVGEKQQTHFRRTSLVLDLGSERVQEEARIEGF